MSDDLVQFLRDRLDEDAEGANNIHDRQSDAYLDGDCICEYPARVIAEVEAKRRVVQALGSAEVSLRNTEPGREPHELMTGAANSLRAAVRMLAAVYVDHPDYRAEWRP
ncbi:MAG TPA: DUF6221 family protein [Nocardioides sp.]|nr:DUF6221 family protein [Nocardioides sp.]